MKKILSTLMVLTLITLFAMTWYSSRKTEQIFTEQITAINQISPEIVKVDLQHYQRRLFSSQAVTVVSIKGKERMKLHHQIRHFVWGVKMVTSLAKESELAAVLAPDQLHLTTDFNLQGASQTKLNVPEISFQDAKGSLKITGLQAHLDFNENLSKGTFNCQIDSLHVQQADQTELDLSNLSISSQMTDLQDIPLGSGELLLEKLNMSVQGQPTVELHTIRYQGKTDLVQNSYKGDATITFAELLLADETVGQGELKLTLSDIDTELLRSLQQTTKKLQTVALNQQSSSFELQLQLLGLYTELLHSGITLTLEKLSLHSGDDQIIGNGTLTLLKKTTAGRTFLSLQNIKGAFQLDIDHGAFVTGYRLFNKLRFGTDQKQNSAVLAEQAEQIAGGLLQKGIFIRQTGDKFHLDFSLSEGQGTLNGARVL